LSPKPKTSNEEEERGNKNGAGPSNRRVVKELRNLRGGKDSPKKEADEQTLEQENFVLHKINYQKYASIATKIGEKCNLKNM
jgi:hypothetical protein